MYYFYYISKHGMHRISKVPECALQNAGTEASAEWVFNHMGDADFNDPLPDANGAAAAAPAGGGLPAADPAAVEQLAAMGFTSTQAEAALQVPSTT